MTLPLPFHVADLQVQRNLDTLAQQFPVGGYDGYQVTTADVSNTSGVSANATGLRFPVASSAAYEYEFWLRISSAALTTGIGVKLTGPVSANTHAHYLLPMSDTTGDPFERWRAGFNVEVLSSSAPVVAPQYFVAYIRGIVTTGSNDGNVQLQFRTEIAASEVRLLSKSFVKWKAL